MPRQSIVLQVFVASPGDVNEERDALDSVVAELNRTWSRTLGVTLEILKWETSTHPGFDEDPQAVINSQVPDDYDLFLGIFWSRLGTPTGRAASGTIEEFERAFSRFSATGNAPEIMLYFKDAPIAPSKLEGAQVGALLDFKSSLAGRGGLYSTFEDLTGFEVSLRAHLSAVAQKFASRKAMRQEPQLLVVAETAHLEESDNGLFDFLEIYTSRTQDMTSAMSSINDATVAVGEQLTQRAAETSNVRGDTHAMRRHVKRTSDDLLRYAATLDSQVGVLSRARHDAFSALSGAVALMPDFPGDAESFRELRTTLRGTIDNASIARTGLAGMRDAVIRLPRISKELNKAKREVTENLGKYLAEIDSTQSTVENVVESISRFLDSIDPSTDADEGSP